MTTADNHGMTKEEFSNNMGSDDDEREDLVIRARGLPWSATPKAVADFFSDCKIRGGAQKGIHFTSTADGRPSGEAFVELATPEDVDNALARSKQYMGKRYVEVFRSKVSEMKWVCSRTGQPADKSKESVLRLRGLPFGVSKEEIAQFFTGLEIVPNGITITLDEDGRNTGDAFVEFASPEIAEQAEKKHKEKIGHRYIEIFKSCKSDIKYVVSPKPKPLMSTRPGPYDRMGGMGPMGPMGGFGGMGRFGGRGSGFDRRGGGRGGFGGQGFGMQNFGGGFGGDYNGYGPMRGGRGGGGRGGFRGGRGGYGGGGGGGSDWDNSASTTGHTVHMRGLPYAAKEADVKQFFMPLNPVAIRIEKKPNGTATGVADVDFATHNDAKAAMSKDRQSMGHRYIELFLHSEDDGNDGSWNQGSGFGQGGGGSNSSSSGGGGGRGGGNFGGGNFGGSSNDNFSNNSGGNFGNQGNMGGNMSGNMSGNMGGNMGGNMSGNMGGNYGNFGGGGSGNYGNQANQGNFSQGSTGNFGGQQSANFGNQGTGFGQQSGFNSQGSGNFGQNQSTGNFGSNQNQQAVQGGGYNTNQQNTGNFGGSSNYGNQMGSNMNTGMNQPFNAQNAAAAATNYGNQSSVAQSGYGQGQQQSTGGYTDSSYASGSGSFFSGMQGQVKQEGQGTGSSMVTYPGYQ